MPELTRDTNQMPWEAATGYPTGTERKVLREEGETRTVLLKLPPAFEMSAHTHMFAEQHFILEGEYEVAGEKYGPGTYQYIPAHTNHGPYTSQGGALVLVIWEGLALQNVGV
jgi:anti-sigma factor ChrR (cupin superfamily)